MMGGPLLDWVESMWPSKDTMSDSNEMVFFVALLISIHETVFWIFTGLLLLADRRGWWKESKIQKGKYASGDLLSECLKLTAFNHFVIQPMVLPGVYYLACKAGLRISLPLPDWQEVVYHLVVFLVVEDTLFYWTHRLLHHRLFFAKVHKMHHRFHTTVGPAAEYAHPVEYILSNPLPFFAGPFLMKSHLFTLAVWLFIRTFEAVDGHSGYDLWWSPFRYFPFRPGAQVHDFHHSHTKGNYASFFTFWDWICGTDQPYKNYMNSQLQQQEQARHTEQEH